MHPSKPLTTGFWGRYMIRLLLATNMLVTLVLVGLDAFGRERLYCILRERYADSFIPTCVLTWVGLTTLTATGLLLKQTLHWRTRSSSETEWNAYVLDAVLLYLWWFVLVAVFPPAYFTMMVPYGG